MKVLMLNTFDEVGGAARAAIRLLKGVKGQGVDARLLVQFKTGQSSDVICNQNPLLKLLRRLKVLLGLLPVRMSPNSPENNFSSAALPGIMPSGIAEYKPDIVHLHWICAGFLSVEAISRLSKPIIWTLHDSWAFTGGCHVPFECKKYQHSCGDCPVLGSSRERDLSRRTWERKAKSWQNLNLTVVAPSHWLADCARSSSLLRNVCVEVIPNGLDTDFFRPMDKVTARKVLGLPQDKKIILFGAVRGGSDPNKGLHLLTPALQSLGKDSPDKAAVVFSSLDNFEMPDFGMPVVSFGQIDDDSLLVMIYSAADVFVAPSLLENFPNTVLEAMACGVPCVAFRQGGMPDLVDHEVSGYLARPYDTEDLARGLGWVLEDMDRNKELSTRARQKIEAEFGIAYVAERYLGLYRDLLGRRIEP